MQASLKIWFLMIVMSCFGLAQNDRLIFESTQGEVGQPATVAIYVQDLVGTAVDTNLPSEGFFSFKFDLTFDPALVSSVSFSEAGLTSSQNFSLLIDASDVSAGQINLLAGYAFGPLEMTPGDAPQLIMHMDVTPSEAAAGRQITFTANATETYIQGVLRNAEVTLNTANGNLDLEMGSITVQGDGGSAPIISSFTATPSSINEGGTSQLSWSVSDADSVTISDIGDVSASGNTDVSPTETTVYTLTATNSFGSNTAQVTVTVVEAGQPTIVAFSAFPTTIVEGNSSTLTWETNDADSVSISPGVGSVAAQGSIQVSPTADTTYTITATNTAGTVTQTTDVTVQGATRIVNFEADPSQIQSGQSSQITWEVENANTVTLNGSAVGASGSQTVSPTQTTTYTLIAEGPFNQVETETITVRVAGDTALAFNEDSFDFGVDTNSRVFDLSVNEVGVYPWTMGALPSWLSSDNLDGNVDSERAFEITLSVNRDVLFPGQSVSHEVVVSSPGIQDARLTVSVTRGLDENATYLYFPLLQADTDTNSQLSVTNLGEGEVAVELLYFLPDGSGLGTPETTSLASKASLRQSLNSTIVAGTAWAMAVITANDNNAVNVAGAVVVRSNNGERLYGIPASPALYDYLVVPHIAKDVDSFFTKSAVVNFAGTERELSVVSDKSFSVGTQGVGSQAFFDYADVMDEDVRSTEWVELRWSEETGGCAGAEVFGFISRERTVGVGLNQNQFNTLYFPHLAADTANFWTGAVVINLGQNTTTVNYEPYNNDGELVDGGFSQTLAPGEKKTLVVLGDIKQFGEGASWVKVTSAEPITGYVLFSNPDGIAADTFAGLEATGTLSNNLAFLHTEDAVIDNGITAIALINPGDTRANIQFRLLDSNGVEKDVVNSRIDPKKKIALATISIFRDVEVAFGDIILVNSDQEITGFELFGDLNHTMGALLAVPY